MILAQGLPNANYVVVSGAQVYWADALTPAIMTSPVGGGGATALVSGGQFSPAGVAANETEVYFSDIQGGAIDSVPVGGGGLTTVASGQLHPYSVVLDADNLYWQTSDAILKMPLGSGVPSTLTSLSQGAASRLALGAGQLFWAECPTAASGSIVSVSVNGGAATTVTATAPCPSSLAADSSNVYWTAWTSGSDSDGVVMSVSLTSGTQTVLASGQDLPSGIAVNGQNVYWINRGGQVVIGSSAYPTGAVLSVPIAGGCPTLLAAEQDQPEDIAVDSANVYWDMGNEADGFASVAQTPQ